MTNWVQTVFARSVAPINKGRVTALYMSGNSDVGCGRIFNDFYHLFTTCNLPFAMKQRGKDILETGLTDRGFDKKEFSD